MNLNEALEAIEGYVELMRLGSRNKYVRKLQVEAFNGICDVVKNADADFIAKIIVNRATSGKDADGKTMY
ncbi:MAG TPA: hypothetical protein VIK78_14605 [Ruminiclostridium sp.]